MRKTVTVAAYRHPKYSHRVRFPGPNGRTKSAYFKNETDALAFAKGQRAALGQEGQAFGTLEREERAAVEFWRAFAARNADTSPPPLLDVLRDYAARWEATRSSVTVEKAVAEYQATKEAEGLRPASLHSIRTRCRRFATAFGDRPVSSITSAEVSDWILGLTATRGPKAGKDIGLRSKLNHRLAIHALFAFAKARGWVVENPVADAAKPKPRKVRPGILHPADVKRFFGALEKTAPELVPIWALRFFAGIRDQEALRMDWSMIDLAAGEIHLPDTITKNGHARTLKIEPALAAFLDPHKRLHGRVCSITAMPRRTRLKRVLARLRAEDDKAKEAGENVRQFPIPMPHNAARHSFATYHLLAFRDAGETSMQLGHGGSPALLWQHYKGAARDPEAKGFWEILPATEPGNVVTMRKTPATESSTRRKAK